MGQVLIRAVALLRRPWVLVLVLLMAGGASAAVRAPLLGVPGFELGLLVTLLLGTIGGGVGVAAARQETRLIQGRDPRPKDARRVDSPFVTVGYAVGAAFILLFAAAALPFLAAVGFALARSACDPFAQAAFYPLLTLPTALLAAAAGVFVGFLTRTPWQAILVYGFFLLVSAVWTAYPIVAGPQVFAFNFFAGYYPGPLYDEALVLRPALLWFRLETLLLAGLFASLASMSLDMRSGRLSGLHVRPGTAGLLAVLGLCVAALEARAPELGIRMNDTYLASRLGGVRGTDHFMLHYPRSKQRLEVDRLARDLEFRYAQISAFLGGGPSEHIDVYVYASPEEKQALVGAAHTQFAQPWRHALHLNDGAFPNAAAKHELVHVMAAPFGSGPFKVTSHWGVFPVMAVVEGFAVAGDNPMGDLSLHEWAAAMRRQKLAPDLRKLFGPGAFYLDAPARAYTVAGSFLRYLSETYGTDKLKSLYRDGDFARAYGRPLDELVTGWERFLDGLHLDDDAVNRAFARFREGSLFVKPCAREVADLESAADAYLASDPERALTLYQRCAEIQPQEPGFAMGQARALSRLNRLSEAGAVLGEVSRQVKDKPALEAEVALARADLDWLRGKPDEAATQLAKVLALKPGPELERTAQLKLAATADPQAGPALFDYFRPGPDDTRLLKLQLALEQSKDNPYLSYLLGRRLQQAGMPALAVKRLNQSLAAKDLPEVIRREAWRLKLQGLYESGDCPGVGDALGQLPDLGPGLKAQAHEWADRCDFEQRMFHAPLSPAEIFR